MNEPKTVQCAVHFEREARGRKRIEAGAEQPTAALAAGLAAADGDGVSQARSPTSAHVAAGGPTARRGTPTRRDPRSMGSRGRGCGRCSLRAAQGEFAALGLDEAGLLALGAELSEYG